MFTDKVYLEKLLDLKKHKTSGIFINTSKKYSPRKNREKVRNISTGFDKKYLQESRSSIPLDK